MSNQIHVRNLRDAEKSVSVALAQAGANTPAIDLEQVGGGLIENIAAEIDIPAVAGIDEAKVLTFALQDSANGTDFAAVDPAVTTTVTGPASGGTPAKKVRIRFNPGVRRYVRVAQTATATAGTFTGNVTFSLLF
jgi:hypothetical protein